MPFPSASSCLGPPSQTYSYKLTYVLRSLLIFPLIWGGWRPVSIHHSSYSVFQFFPLILPFSQPTYRSRLSISKPTNKGSHSSLTRAPQYWVSFLHILVPLRAIHIWNLISFISYFTTINILTSEHSPYTPFAPHYSIAVFFFFPCQVGNVFFFLMVCSFVVLSEELLMSLNIMAF